MEMSPEPDLTNERESPDGHAARRGVVVLLVLAWIALVGAGMGAMEFKSLASGAQGAPRDLHASEFASDRMTLIVAIHPRCPCSPATLENLARMATRCGDGLACRVLMFVPEGADDPWRRGRCWDAARLVPGVEIAEDIEGAAARRLGAFTSGAAVLLDRDGSVRFTGGLTSARGHAGENRITQSIVDIVQGRPGDVTRAPVFGCAIVKPDWPEGAES